MRLEELPISREVKEYLSKKGYVELYPPQEEAVKTGLLDGESLVVFSPTASGKTLIAVIAAAKHLEEGLGKVVYLTPLRALAYEKYSEFKFLEEVLRGVRVSISTGDYDTSGSELKDSSVIVATNEKMDSLLRHSPSWLSEVSLVIADEIHLVGLEDRGPTLEVLMTRVRREIPEAQVLALSATIPNAVEISEWLDAKVVSCNWRPVPLREGVFYRYEVYFNDGRVERVNRLIGKPVIDLVLDELSSGGQSMVFTKTRGEAVRLAGRIAQTLSGIHRFELDSRGLKRVSDRILVEGERTSLSEMLSSYVKMGVAFHHAGLTNGHRRIIEEAFRSGLIKVLTATPTLAAGVNLPSRRVIITYHSRYSMGLQEPLTIFEYKQMAGRAGRPQFDEYGEAIMVANSRSQLEYLYDFYVEGEPERITSKLGSEEVLETHVLGLIASKSMVLESEVLKFFENTLYYIQNPPAKIKSKVVRAIQSLLANELIKRSGRVLTATRFGRRVSELYISPSTGVLFKEMSEELGGEEPLINYLYMICCSTDMPLLPLYKREVGRVEKKLDELVYPVAENRFSYMSSLQRLKTAIVLEEWINERSEEEILDGWRVEPGDLHGLAYTAEWLLYSASQIFKLFKNFKSAKLLEVLSRRVRYGVRGELLDLVELEGVGRVRARMLFNSGFKDLASLAKAPLDALRRVPTIGEKLAKSIKDQAKRITGL